MLQPQIESISKGTPVCQYPRKAYNRIVAILNYLEGGAGVNIMRNGDKWTLAIDRVWLAGFIEALISPEIDSAQNEAVSEALADAGAGIATIVAGTPTVGQATTTTPLTITLTNGNTQSVNVAAANGARGLPGQDGEDGQDGVGISGISAGTATSSGGYTTTPVTVTLTSGTTQAFNVVAKNGAQGPQGTTGPQGPQGPAGPTVTVPVRVLTGLSYSTVSGELTATYDYIKCQGRYGNEREEETVFETVPELP